MSTILLLVQIKQDKKEDKSKIRTKQYIKLNNIAKKIYRLNPRTPDDRRHTQQKNPTISSIDTNLSQTCLRILGLTHGRAMKEESNDKDSTALKTEYTSREIQQLNPSEPDNGQSTIPQPSHLSLSLSQNHHRALPTSMQLKAKAQLPTMIGLNSKLAVC